MSNLYVNPFVVGIVCTIITEIMFVIVVVIFNLKRNRLRRAATLSKPATNLHININTETR